jgi:hypothetical protein
MSFANPRPINPASKFIEFKGDKGVFSYYLKPEKEGDEGKTIEVPFPVKFIVIDELSTITGFNDANQCGVYSNEVHNIKEVLSVRLFKGRDGIVGVYNEIKGEIKSLGGKFTKSVYALMVTDNKSELVNFKVKGSFLNAWIESGINTDIQGIYIEACNKKKKGNTSYFEPIITGFTPPDPVKTKAVAQKYYNILKTYFEQRKHYTEEQVIVEEETKTDPDNEDNIPAGDDSDLPF